MAAELLDNSDMSLQFMTWGEFKRRMEEEGAMDGDFISTLHINFPAPGDELFVLRREDDDGWWVDLTE